MADKTYQSEPAGTYQVWHRHGDAYRHVANVEAGNYMAAVVLPLFERGAPGTERLTWLVNPARPTTYGDKIVDPLGAAYEIYKPDFGGTALREITMPEARTLATREVTPHPWPSEIARANRHKQPGQEQCNGNDKTNGKDAGHGK